MEFYRIFRPLTAVPFRNTKAYMEYEPCDALKPYVRCFWGSREPHLQADATGAAGGLVIPDTCMDIIFDMNYSENKIQNKFCGINDMSFYAAGEADPRAVIGSFGIRFYAWTAVMFSDESMAAAKNVDTDVGYYFSKLKRALEPLLMEPADMPQRVRAAEKYLLKYIRPERENTIVMEGVAELLQHRGNLSMMQLSGQLHVGCRQLERLFKTYVGTPPKQLASLIRYQSLWSDIILKRDFNLLDAVYEFGYTDQSHLIRDFKRFHTMTPMEARALALNGSDGPGGISS